MSGLHSGMTWAALSAIATVGIVMTLQFSLSFAGQDYRGGSHTVVTNPFYGW